MDSEPQENASRRLPVLAIVLLAAMVLVATAGFAVLGGSQKATAAPTVVNTAAKPFMIGPTTSNQLSSTYAPTLVPSRASVAYGANPAQVLDVYLPQGKQAGTILYFHSGGWGGGTRTDIAPAIEYQLTRGWAIVSADYRLTPTVRAAGVMGDANQALRYVHAYAKSLGLTAGPVVVAGESAGGHIAATLGLEVNVSVNPNLPANLKNASTRIDGVVDQVGPPDLQKFWRGSAWMQNVEETFLGCVLNRATMWSSSSGLPNCTVAQEQKYSPTFLAQLHIGFGIAAPPVFMAYGGSDPLVPPSVGAQRLGNLWAQAAPGKAWFDFEPASSHYTSYYLNINDLDSWFNHVGGVTPW